MIIWHQQMAMLIGTIRKTLVPSLVPEVNVRKRRKLSKLRARQTETITGATGPASQLDEVWRKVTWAAAGNSCNQASRGHAYSLARRTPKWPCDHVIPGWLHDLETDYRAQLVEAEWYK